MLFVGDLSIQDAAVLENLGSRATSILEFGVGGSTQILCGAAPHDATLASVDTDPEWIVRTAKNLDLLGLSRDRHCFANYQTWVEELRGRVFDLVFVDGVGQYRVPFARAAWNQLCVGGIILFHDTRRELDLKDVFGFMLERFHEVADPFINTHHSNLSGFRRKAPEPYENWNVTEGKPDWAYGLVPPPDNWPSLLT